MQILLNTLGLIWLIGLSALCIKGRIRLFSFLVLFALFVYTALIGLICFFNFPANSISGKINPAISIIIALSHLFMAFYALFIKKSVSTSKDDNKKLILRWLLLVLGLVFFLSSIAMPLIFFYVPQSFGYTESKPMYGVISSIFLVSVSAIVLYIFSRFNSNNFPNLTKKIVALLIFLFFSKYTLVLSIVLMYSFPIEPPAAYPFEALINIFSTIIWGGLLLLITRDFVVEECGK